MKIYETRKKEVEVPTKIVCDATGLEIDLQQPESYLERNKMHSFTLHFGYGSDFDYDVWEVDVSEKAMLEWIKTFASRPDGFAAKEKYPDQVFKEWQETGEYNWQAGWTKQDFLLEEKRNEELNKRLDQMKRQKTPLWRKRRKQS
ncbi:MULTISPECIES: hypothetical protein [Bacillus subtilis group]|uniref:hypothetical protein n=1 Tax=Bacillus subtilis group TaxID=653685 RepID=UPI0004A7991B|nr:hypothetical protein [Bacillus velezensis]MDH3118892.1 hypothetical protein [Bacillus subtilis]AUS16048.1 hypothetical protein C0W57_07590 [Bacillus velezensis]MED3629107.1 hypothetical protein [Bacillus subtilis]URD66587.1 hypothetical protein M8X21_21365 [Bacillus velezensis]WED88367.1 hypothetical protein PXG99_04570 [Bacillus velezensis]